MDKETEDLIMQLTAQLEREKGENRKNFKTIELMEEDIRQCEKELLRKDERIKYLGLILSKRDENHGSKSKLPQFNQNQQPHNSFGKK